MMISSRWTAAPELPVTIRPPFELRANAATSRSISPASRTSIGVNSTPNDGGAMAWIAANWPIPAASAGSRRMAIRVRLGAISLNSSSHFPLGLYSNAVNPVALPPGCANLATRPAPTGSMTFANTIGTVRVVCRNAATLAPPPARMTSAASATIPPRMCEGDRHHPQPNRSRSARCGRRSNPIPAVPAGRPRGEPVLPDRLRPCSGARRRDASGRPAARARRAATRMPRRKEG